MKNTKHALNQIAMAPFDAIFGQNRSHRLWEASGCVAGGTSKPRLSANPPAPPRPQASLCLLHRETLCLGHIENARFWTEIMKYGLNQVAMPLFGAIFGQNPSHGVWEASGMPPGP